MAQSVFLQYARFGQLCVGMYPQDPNWNRAFKIFYKCYYYFVLLYFITFVFTQWMQVYSQLGVDFFGLLDALYVSILYSVTAPKIYIVLSAKVKELNQQLVQTERVIMNDRERDPEMLSIFYEHVKKCKFSAITIYFWGSFTLMMFFIHPYLKYLEFNMVDRGNATFHKEWVFASWFPFDKNDYYVETFTFQVLAGCICGGLTMAVDTTMWALMVFVIAQLKILQYKLKNFKKHAAEYMAFNALSDERMAVNIMIKKCILMHKIIITYNIELNNSINILMLFDFLTCSLQLGITGTRLVILKEDASEILHNAEFIVCMLVQMVIFYWYANEIILESLNVSMAVWESDWLDCTDDVKKNLNFLVLRSQSPLKLEIGQFATMSTATALSILKASFSYVSFMRQVYS